MHVARRSGCARSRGDCLAVRRATPTEALCPDPKPPWGACSAHRSLGKRRFSTPKLQPGALRGASGTSAFGWAEHVAPRHTCEGMTRRWGTGRSWLFELPTCSRFPYCGGRVQTCRRPKPSGAQECHSFVFAPGKLPEFALLRAPQGHSFGVIIEERMGVPSVRPDISAGVRATDRRAHGGTPS